MSDSAQAADPAAEPAADMAAWGALVVAGMPLALPLAVLREVLPLKTLSPLPCAEAAVVGGLDLRGVTVPVLDLGPLLPERGRPAQQAANCVVLVEHQGRLLGLLAQGVQGIFEATLDKRNRVATAAPLEARNARERLFAGSVRRHDSGALVNLLSPEALATLPGVPWIDDPEPLRQHDAAARLDADNSVPVDESVSLMLVRCGRLALAIDALTVFATLWEPRIERSPLTLGGCRGVLAFNQMHVAALDLSQLCGLGPLSTDGPHQALVVKRPEGFVALLVEQVNDIVRVPRSLVVPMATFALPVPQLFRGVLAGASLEGIPVVGVDTRRQDFLAVDDAALLAHPDVQALAATNTPVDSGPAQRAGRGASPGHAEGAAPASGSRALITFCLPAETAVPIEQVQEILPYGDKDAMFGPESVLRRIQVLRGRSVPVLCLTRLMGGRVEQVHTSAAVLVVQVNEHWVGFGLPMLQSIEHSAWEQELPRASGSAQSGNPVAAVLARRRVATLGRGSTERTVQLLDLKALAEALLQGGGLMAA